MHELLTPSQMSVADQETIEKGIPGIELMENAGRAVAKIVEDRFSKAQNILFVCGTGNNGGDGFIAARDLHELGKRIQVVVCGDITRISGDAELALAKLEKSMLIESHPDFADFDLVVDALFGAGLDREVTGDLADMVRLINECGKPVLSVDLPSGIDGRTGKIMGCAINATHTATFFRFKPGHLLLPGRARCGERSLHQIGISDEVLKQTGISGIKNVPAAWQQRYPIPYVDGHKYDRGHTLVFSGPANATGAARLLAQAALRSGSGLVTIVSPKEAMAINAAHLTSVMLVQGDSQKELEKILEDKRINCIALGSGMAPNKHTKNTVLKVLRSGRKTVLDAGALTAFANDSDLLFEAIMSSPGDVYLTPHSGEFASLFPDLTAQPSKIDMACAAAKQSGAVVVLKGPDTIVATPNELVSIADNAPPWLATAGSGDVLAGMVAGLASQSMPAFEAASAAVWLHGDAANRLGPGLVSSDLDEALRQSIRAFLLSQAG